MFDCMSHVFPFALLGQQGFVFHGLSRGVDQRTLEEQHLLLVPENCVKCIRSGIFSIIGTPLFGEVFDIYIDN